MTAIRSALPLAVMLVLLQGCASAPDQPASEATNATSVPAAAEADPVPELTLNIPDTESCACIASPAGEGRDLTFLERGFSSLVAGEYIEAVQYFERYKRLEDSPASDWEAGVAIAYISMLAESPFHDPETARKSYRKLRKKYGEELKVHESVLMMRDSLETFIGMDRRLDELQTENQRLEKELAKRDAAIKRLRELTVGQKGAAQ